MFSEIAKRTLSESRRSIVGWSLGIAAMLWLEFAVYPTVRDQPSFADIAKNYPKELKAFFGLSDQLDFHSARGFIGTELFSFMLPLMFILAAVFIAARSIATEEERHTLEILMANPISRSRLAWSKAFGVLLVLVLISLITLVSLVLGNALFSMQIALSVFVQAMAATTIIAIWAGAWSFAIGAATGRHGIALTIGAVIAFGSYIVDSLAKIVDALDGINRLSIYHYTNPMDAFQTSISYGSIAIFAGISAVLILLSTIFFNRRDIK